MPPLETMDLTDRAVLWVYTGNATREGEPIVYDPVEVRVRWEEGQREIPNVDGTLLTVDVSLATTRQIPLNSIMWEGKLTDLVLNGLPTTDIYEVIHRERGKDIKGRVTRWEFALRRYKDVIPKVIPLPNPPP